MTALAGTRITLVSFTPTGTRDASGMLTPAPDSTSSTDVPGCLHRPVPETAVRELHRQYREVGIVVGTNSWRTTTPVVPATLNAKPGDHLIVGGLTFIIMGTSMFNSDMAGKPSHMTIISERQTAGH
jgi:hypothetical protein